MPPIERTDEGLRLQLDGQEAEILRELAKEMRLLLAADIPAQDDVMQRLFPRAHEDDEEEQIYRELVGNELANVKNEALQMVEAALGAEGDVDVTLSDEEAETWLRFLNDLRLAIGTRLDVDEAKMERPFDPEDPEGPALSVLHWLGWLQGSMLEMTLR